MSYYITFKVKVEGLENRYVVVYDCSANITWNLRDMIRASTGLEWKNEEINGLCKDIIPKISNGYNELTQYPEKYKQYESSNGWGTLAGCRRFFLDILLGWDNYCADSWTKDLADVTYFYIG